jgi:hypothetical protein
MMIFIDAFRRLVAALVPRRLNRGTENVMSAFADGSCTGQSLYTVAHPRKCVPRVAG